MLMVRRVLAMRTLKMTSKRQVTFPMGVCEDLGVSAGESLVLERIESHGHTAWAIRPYKRRKESWFGRLRDYAIGKQHDMPSIRRSVGSVTRGV